MHANAHQVQKTPMSEMKQYFNASHRPAAFHLIVQCLKERSPPYPALDKRSLLDYMCEYLPSSNT